MSLNLQGEPVMRFLLKRDERIDIRLDMGFGRNSSGVYFTLEEAY